MESLLRGAVATSVQESSLRRSEMFIAWSTTKTVRRSEGRNDTGWVLIKLSSAPPNGVGFMWRTPAYKHFTPNGVTGLVP